MSNRLRVAVVEMTILVRSKHDPSLTDTLMKTLQSPEGRRERRQQVIAILDALDAREAPQTDLVIFPGWTLVGKSVPRWFREATNQWTTVVEMLPSEGGSKAKAYREWRTHVLPPTTTPGSVGVGASTQRLHETAASAVERQALLQDLRRSRDWEIVGHPPAKGRLLICGEVNCVGLRDASMTPLIKGLADLPLSKVIVNPAHRPPGSALRRAQMNAKRNHLAGQGTLLTTANRFEFADTFEGRRWNRLDGSTIAFSRGKVLAPRSVESIPYVGSTQRLLGNAAASHRVYRYEVAV